MTTAPATRHAALSLTLVFPLVLAGCGGGETKDSGAAFGDPAPVGMAPSAPPSAVPAAAPAPAPVPASAPAPAPASAPAPATTAYAGVQSVAASFELLGGYRLDQSFAGEGLALVTDSAGFAVEAIASGHTASATLNVYDLRAAPGRGSDVAAYPVLGALRQWRVAELFPSWLAGQNLRDVAVTSTATGYEVLGIGRVYYNTSPRSFSQINARQLVDGGRALGSARVIAVDLPEQEFSGFVKHVDSALDASHIGAGAYDSGQGSVGGLSYARQQPNGTWRRLLTPPGFGDVVSPRLPRDGDYSCPDGTSWVCIPPQGSRGVWSTERIGGGAVRYGDNLLFIPMLGYGPRSYALQSYTFGDAAKDKAVAYFFKVDAATGAVRFQNHDRWVHSPEGQPTLGVAIGRLRGIDGQLLFVVTGYAWRAGAYKDGSVLQVFRIKPG